jgi:hypothetical protein
MQVLEKGWNLSCNQEDKAKKLGAKFKTLRKILRQWHSKISNMTKLIDNNKITLAFLDSLEKFRDLALEEWNFRKLVQENLGKLLDQQREYWKQRGKIKWATLGDENTIFFHSTATISHNRNSIMMLKYINGVKKSRHEEKADII